MVVITEGPYAGMRASRRPLEVGIVLAPLVAALAHYVRTPRREGMQHCVCANRYNRAGASMSSPLAAAVRVPSGAKLALACDPCAPANAGGYSECIDDDYRE